MLRSDVEIHHLETRQPLKFAKVSVLEEGPLRAAVSAELNYGQSTINVVVRSPFTIVFVLEVISVFIDLVARSQWSVIRNILSYSLLTPLQRP